MRLMVFYIFTLSLNCFANEQEDAINKIQKAILSYPIIIKTKNKLEQGIINHIPVEKETIGIVGGVALSASQGYVDTRVIKKINIEIAGGNMRPDIKYDFKKSEADGSLSINWSF